MDGRIARRAIHSTALAQFVDAATIRGARVAVSVCAALIAALIVASVWLPQLVFWDAERHLADRLLLALLLTMPVSLALALRDPVRNAGVFAVIGFGCGALGAARAMNAFLATDLPRGALRYPSAPQGSETVLLLGTIGLFAVAVTLVVTYTRLRRPHPIVVRVVVVATAFLPVALWLYDWLAINLAGR